MFQILLWNASSSAVCYFEMLLRPGAEHLKYYVYPSRECSRTVHQTVMYLLLNAVMTVCLAVHDCVSSSHRLAQQLCIRL